MACVRTRATARRGWTMTELVAVLAIILILAAFGAFIMSAGQGVAEKIEAEAQAAAAHVEKSQALQKPVHQKPGAAHGMIRRTPPGGVVPDHYTVRFKPTVNAAVAAQQLARHAAVEVRHVYNHVYKGASVRGKADAAARIKDLPFVASVDQDHYFYTCAETIPTGVQRISVSRTKLVPPVVLSLPVSTTGSGVRNIRLSPGSASATVVAVVDTGIDSSHPDLNVTNSQGFGFANGLDQNGHGTHVAGTVGALHNTIGVIGVFPGVSLWSLRVLDAQGAGVSSDLVAGLDYAAQHAGQIQVVNMSLGGPLDQTVTDATTALLQLGVVVVCAAGNSAQDAATGSPGSTPGVICVAALADSDGLPGGKGPVTPAGPDDTFANFSNFGSTVAVIAPGVDILSTAPGGGYQLLSGTSMASPHVAGLAALTIADRFGRANLGTPRNVRPKGSKITPGSGSPGSPAGVRAELISNTVESIPGTLDARSYPLVTGLP